MSALVAVLAVLISMGLMAMQSATTLVLITVVLLLVETEVILPIPPLL
jgi:hypothetical protein